MGNIRLPVYGRWLPDTYPGLQWSLGRRDGTGDVLVCLSNDSRRFLGPASSFPASLVPSGAFIKLLALREVHEWLHVLLISTCS